MDGLFLFFKQGSHSELLVFGVCLARYTCDEIVESQIGALLFKYEIHLCVLKHHFLTLLGQLL